MFVGCWAHKVFGALGCGVALDIAACVCAELTSHQLMYDCCFVFFLVVFNKLD